MALPVLLAASLPSLLVQPRFGGAQCAHARVTAHPACDLTTGSRRETRFAPVVEVSPGKRYREMAAAGEKFYTGRGSARVDALKTAFKDAGDRKIVVITGASSGLGFFCVQSLLGEATKDGYYVVTAVRDPAKMDMEAKESGIAKTDYTAVELQLASFQSVKDFAEDLTAALPGGKLDRLVCNAAVYLPTDPVPRWTDDGYEMSLQVNHLGHFLLVQKLLPALEKADGARCCIVGSVTGNKNTVAGSLVKPIADVGDLSGLKAGAGQVMVDGAKKFDGAKAYKDAKALNMMTMLELHRRKHESTGVVFSSMYPGCIASTNLFREKREWFRYFFFPTLMKAIGSYVTQPEAGERLAACVTDDATTKSGVYWSWNGNAMYMGVGTAGGSGGEIFENQVSGMCREELNGQRTWDYSMEAVKDFL